MKMEKNQIIWIVVVLIAAAIAEIGRASCRERV